MLIESPQTTARLEALRLLLDDPRLDADHVDWHQLRLEAERTGIIVRLADAVTQRGEELPPKLAESAAAACGRTQRVLEIVDRLRMGCEHLGVAHVFLKTAERYPDSGPDVDLLIAETSPAIDRALLRALPAVPRRRSLLGRLRRSCTYAAAHGIVIDIWHGRLGRLGEHARYARLLLERAAPVTLGATTCRAPSPADNLLLIAADQIYTRPAFRLSDVYWSITALRRGVNWDYLFATAVSTGTLSAVGTYLQYINRCHERMFGRALLAPDIHQRFQGLLRVFPKHDPARFPPTRTAARLYLQHVGSTLESGRWHSAARLSLLPLFVVNAFAGGHRRTR